MPTNNGNKSFLEFKTSSETGFLCSCYDDLEYPFNIRLSPFYTFTAEPSFLISLTSRLNYPAQKCFSMRGLAKHMMIF